MQNGFSQLHLLIKGTGCCSQTTDPGLERSRSMQLLVDFQVQNISARDCKPDNIENVLTGK